MPYSVKGFFEIDADMVQILLVLEVLFTQDSEVEDLFCGASSRSEPSLFFSNYFFSLGFSHRNTKSSLEQNFALLGTANAAALYIQHGFSNSVRSQITKCHYFHGPI